MVSKRKAYQKYARGGAVPLAIEVNTPAADPTALEDMIKQDGNTQRDSGDDADASVAFPVQIDALRKAEQNQREQNEQFQRDRCTMSREQKEQHWRENGIGGDDLKYLHEPEDNPHVTVMAVADARKQGLAEDTDQFHQAVKHNFRRLLPKLKDHTAELEEAYRRGDTEAQA